MTSYWKILRQTATEFMDDEALRLSAALSYYSAFSLAPLLLIAIAVAGWVLGDEAVRGQLDGYLRGSLGTAGATALQEMIARARKPEKNVMASVIGIAMLLFGAGGLFGQLQDALNTVWGVKRRGGRGWKGLVKDRFLSFAMVLGTGFLLLTSMIASAILQSLSEYVGSILSLSPAVWAVISGIASFLIITALCSDLQAFARCEDLLEGCVSWSRLHRRAVHPRQVCDGLVPRPRSHCLRLWRDRRAGSCASVGLLLVNHPAFRSGVHPSGDPPAGTVDCSGSRCGAGGSC
jgi:hypothetical protein